MHYHKHDPNDNESFKFKARIIRRPPNAGNTEAHAYDSVKGNCVHVIVTEFLLFSVKENVTWFGSIGTTYYFFLYYYDMMLGYLHLNHPF